jgi:hypothetical protein
MDKAGARYKYIEQFLGIGGFLVLGKDISETTYVFNFSTHCWWLTGMFRWTKLLPKSSPDFRKVMDHLKVIGLPLLASEYRNLRMKLIDHELQQIAALIGEPMPRPAGRAWVAKTSSWEVVEANVK